MGIDSEFVCAACALGGWCLLKRRMARSKRRPDKAKARSAHMGPTSCICDANLTSQDPEDPERQTDKAAASPVHLVYRPAKKQLAATRHIA